LKTIILSYPNRPVGFSIVALYGNIDIRKFSQNDIERGLNDLLKKGFLITTDDKVYELSREQFLKTREYYKWSISFLKAKRGVITFVKFLWKHFIITIITAAITSYVAVKMQYHYQNEKHSSTKNYSSIVKNKK